MPIELLAELAARQLPVVITNPADVDKLRLLSAAALVVLKLAKEDADTVRAEVVAITDKGKKAIAGAPV
ncbi:MAG: hypothetical protein Q7T87_16910 [Polaromonas sp.]|nr:hypothetical protein [Polaromonas sp.]